MARFRRRRPSPSMIVALIALFVSLGGVSYGVATGSIDSRAIRNNTIRTQDIRNNTIRTRDIRNNEVRGRDIRNSTIRGVDVALNTLTGLDIDESQLGTVPSATVALSPLAFARVSPSGQVIEADSRGVGAGNVSHSGSRYCFRGLSFAFRSAQVTVDYAGTSGLTAQVAKPNVDCPAGTQLEVVTSGSAPAGFYVWFFD